MNTQAYDRLLPPGRLIAVLSVVLMLSGCAEFARRFPDLFPREQTVAAVEKPAPVMNVPEPEPDFTHIVTWPGESLSVIATWYTGRVTNWRAIAAANPQLDPNRIFIGDTVVIPKELLVTTKDMPEAFVNRFTGHSKPSVPDMDKGDAEDSQSSGPAIGDTPEGTASGPGDMEKVAGGKTLENGAVPPTPEDSGGTGSDSDAFKLFGPKE